jgi:hypothetical protein
MIHVFLQMQNSIIKPRLKFHNHVLPKKTFLIIINQVKELIKL